MLNFFTFKLFQCVLTVPWKGFGPLIFCFVEYLKHLIQIIKLILILHKYNAGKYKMQFLNDDFIYWGKKVVQTYLALRENLI